MNSAGSHLESDRALSRPPHARRSLPNRCRSRPFRYGRWCRLRVRRPARLRHTVHSPLIDCGGRFDRSSAPLQAFAAAPLHCGIINNGLG
jgi:hypothetical protein